MTVIDYTNIRTFFVSSVQSRKFMAESTAGSIRGASVGREE